jgi:preprotein translocase subunit YajC
VRWAVLFSPFAVRNRSVESMNFIFIIILFVLAWVVLILPKQRELKRHNALIEALEVGDEVMSGSGLYGTIVGIESDTVLLQVAPNVELKLARRAIAAKVLDPATDDTAVPLGDSDEDSSEGNQS